MEQQAREVASKGRYGDSMLVHMNPIEVAWMHENSPTGLTINPETGQPEAFLPLLGALAGGWLGSSMGLSVLGGAALTGLGSFAGSMLQGDSLEQGMMTGLMSFGTAGLMGALGGGAAEAAGAGAGVGGPELATQAATATPAGMGGDFGPLGDFYGPSAVASSGTLPGGYAANAWGPGSFQSSQFGPITMQPNPGDLGFNQVGIDYGYFPPAAPPAGLGFNQVGIDYGYFPPTAPQVVSPPPQVVSPPPQVAPPSVAAAVKPTPALDAYLKKNPDAGMYDPGRMGAVAKDRGGWQKHISDVFTDEENLPYIGAAGLGIVGGGLDPILGGDQGTIPDPTKDRKDIPEQFPSERVALRPWENEEEYQERLRRGQEMLYFNPVALPRNTAAEGGLVKGYADGGSINRDAVESAIYNPPYNPSAVYNPPPPGSPLSSVPTQGFQYRSPSDPGFASTVLSQTPMGAARDLSKDEDVPDSAKIAMTLAPVAAAAFVPGSFVLSGLGAVLNAMGAYTDLGPSNPDNIDPSSISLTGRGNIAYTMEGPGGRGYMTNPLGIVNALNNLDEQTPGAMISTKYGRAPASEVALMMDSRDALGRHGNLSFNPANPNLESWNSMALRQGFSGIESVMTQEEMDKEEQEAGDRRAAAIASMVPGLDPDLDRDLESLPDLDDPNLDYEGIGGPAQAPDGGGFWSALASAFTGPGSGPGGAPGGWTWGGAGPAYGSVPDGMGGSRAPVGPNDAGGLLGPGGSVTFAGEDAGQAPGGGYGPGGTGGESGSFDYGAGDDGSWDDGSGYGGAWYNEGGLVKRQGYANGGQVQPQQNPIVQGAIAAIMGNHPQPRQAIAQFVQVYGQQAFTALRQQVITDTTEQQREGSGLGAFVRGQGDGLSDSIPANIDGQEPVALSDGEVVVPADVVSGLGNGSSEAGAEKIEEMGKKVRQKRTGSKKQPRAVDASQLIMGMA